MYRKVSPTKIRERRGGRPRRAIIEAAGAELTQQDLYLFEKGMVNPSLNKLPYLLKGLGCSWEDISEPVDLRLAA